MTFYGEPVRREVYDNIHESPSAMTAPLVTLATLSFFYSSLCHISTRFLITAGSRCLSRHRTPLCRGTLTPGPRNCGRDASCSYAGHVSVNSNRLQRHWLSGAHVSAKRISADDIAAKLALPYKLSLNKFFVDETYQRYLINPSLILARMIAFVDWELYDKYIVNGFGKVTEWFSRVVGIRWDYDILDQKIVDGVGRSTSFWFRTPPCPDGKGSELSCLGSGRSYHDLCFSNHLVKEGIESYGFQYFELVDLGASGRCNGYCCSSPGQSRCY